MSLETIRARMADLNAEVSGITTSLPTPPRDVNTAQIPLAYPLYLGRTPEGLTDGALQLTYRFIVRVIGDPLGQGIDNDARLAKLEPIDEALLVKYAAHLLLNNLAGILRIEFGASEIHPLYGYAVLDVPINVQEQKNTTFGV